MYFQAESNNSKWDINVEETRSEWKVSLKNEDEDNWKEFLFSKSDYQYMDDTISFLFKDSSYLLDVTHEGVDYTVYTRGTFRTIKVYNEEKILHESLKQGGSMDSSSDLASKMPGKIVKIFVKPGDTVPAGEPILVMEAMKMENEMRVDREVKVKSIEVKEGQAVESNVTLVSFEAE